MREDLLHHIWRLRLFKAEGLRTADGRPLEVIRPGELSRDAGPDFTNARIRIGGIEWAGNIEIHVRASDWLRHSHGDNPAYGRIILHVVFENDVGLALGDFPTLELRPYVSDQVLRRYAGLMGSPEAVPCGSAIASTEQAVLTNWLERLLLERLERKSAWMGEVIGQCGGDLEQAFFVIVARTLGMKVNADPFEHLSRILPVRVLLKHRDSILQLEALLFGAAGMLEDDFSEEWPQLLRKEFAFLRHKYGLSTVDGSAWKFLRLRPANFPTVRLAQLAAMIHSCGPLLGWYAACFGSGARQRVKARPSEYWETHYRFGQPSAAKPKPMGSDMQRHVIINAVAPYLIVMADREHRQELREQAVELLYATEAETNARIAPFRSLGVRIGSAAEAQALLELRSNWCDMRRCLGCAVGTAMLRRPG